MKRSNHILILKDHEIRELINNLRDVAIEHGWTASLRGEIARVVKEAVAKGQISFQKETE